MIAVVLPVVQETNKVLNFQKIIIIIIIIIYPYESSCDVIDYIITVN